MGEEDTAEEAKVITTTVLFAGENRDLLRAGIAALLKEAIVSGELRETELDDGCAKDAIHLLGYTDEVRRHGRKAVILLLDPVGPRWLEAADKLRADKQVAIIPIVARPSYRVQRAWRQPTPSGARKASGMLATTSPVNHLAEAIRRAAKTPADIGMWIHRNTDNEPVAVHPHEFLRGMAPEEVADLVRKRKDLRKLVLAAHMSNKDAAAVLKIQHDSFTESLKGIREKFGAPSDVALGRIAAQFGLFDDFSIEWLDLDDD